MPSITLDEFLERERSTGANQGEGQFTFDLQVAVDKLSRYQFEDPLLCLLRVLQCAATIGGRRVDLRIKGAHQELSFEVEDPGSFGMASSLLLALAKPPGTRNPIEHLASAVQGTLGLGALETCWIHEAPHKREEIRFAENGVKVSQRFERERNAPQGVAAMKPSRFILRVNYPESGRNWLQRVWDILVSRPKRHKLFEERALTLPTELSLGGKPVKRLGEESFNQVCTLAGKRVLELGFRVRSLQPSRLLVADGRGGGITSAPDSDFRCSLFARPRVAEGNILEVRFVREGVVVHTESVTSFEAPCQVWVDASTLQTDLSGLRLVKDQAFEDKLREIQSFARHWKTRLELIDSGYRDSDLI